MSERKPPALAYARAACVTCGARTELQAETRCKPSSDETGEYYCAGEFDPEGFSIRPTTASLKALDDHYDSIAPKDDPPPMTDTGQGDVEKVALRSETYEQAVQRIGRVAGFAPGDYVSICGGCGRHFDGDKRAIHCLPCAVAALKASPPEGWVMVPVEPTPAMCMAWAKSLNPGAAWTAMLAASPVKASPALQDEEAQP